jgi:hypothetical protein
MTQPVPCTQEDTCSSEPSQRAAILSLRHSRSRARQSLGPTRIDGSVPSYAGGVDWKVWSGRKGGADSPHVDEDSSISELSGPALAQKGAVWCVFFFAVPAIAVSAIGFVRGYDVAGNVGWFLGAIALAGFGIRVLRIGVSIEVNDVVVRNVFSTKRIPLSAITGVEPRTGWGAKAQHGQMRRVFLLAGSERIRVDALGSSNAMVRKENAERLWTFLHP